VESQEASSGNTKVVCHPPSLKQRFMNSIQSWSAATHIESNTDIY